MIYSKYYSISLNPLRFNKKIEIEKYSLNSPKQTI